MRHPKDKPHQAPATTPPANLRVRPIAEIIKASVPAPTYLIPYLLPANANLLITVDEGVEVGIFLNLLTYCIGTGKTLNPFGGSGTQGVPTLLCCAALNQHASAQCLRLIGARDKNKISHQNAASNIFVYQRDADDDAPLNLNSKADQETLRRAIPDECGAVLIDDLSEWAIPDSPPNEFEGISLFFRSLNRQGVAVVVVMSSSKRQARSYFRKLGFGVRDVHIHLAHDPAAPTEFGGGFKVVRRRIDELDPVPTTFSFHYAVIDNALDFGWSCPTPESVPLSAKKVAMLERQKRLTELLAQGKSQKEAAELLGMNSSTVSRDVSRMAAADAQANDLADEEFDN